MPEKKQDRELIELLNELRVALPGVQVLFAFLLIFPFSQGFTNTTLTQRGAFFIALITTSISSALLIAPSSFHRIQWRQDDKERLLVISNGFAIAGLAFLAVSMTAVVFTVTDFLYGSPMSVVAASAVGAIFLLLWYVIPLYRRSKND